MEFASIANCPADFVGAKLWSYACLTVEPTLADYGGTNMSHVNEYSPWLMHFIGQERPPMSPERRVGEAQTPADVSRIVNVTFHVTEQGSGTRDNAACAGINIAPADI